MVSGEARTSMQGSGDIKISRKSLLVGLVAILIMLILGLLWQLGVYDKVLDKLLASEIQLVVKDTESKKPIDGAEVTIGKTSGKTDKNGQVLLGGLRAGNYQIVVSAKGYKDADQLCTLKKGGNVLDLSLRINVERITFSGTVNDFVNEQPIEAVSVNISTGSAVTSKSGTFDIAKIPVGETEISLKKEGYNDKTEKVVVEKGKNATFTLAPSGKIVFISSREEAKRGIYSGNYDGSDIKPLIKRVDDTEDFNVVVGPNRNKMIFLSTRDKRKPTDSAYDPVLYMINIDGTSLIKLTNHYGVSGHNWSADGSFVAWNGRESTDNYDSNLYLYSLLEKKVTKLNDSGATYGYQFSHDGTAIAWNQNVTANDPNSVAGIFYKNLINGETKKISDKGYLSDFSNDDKNIRFSFYDDTDKKTKYQQYLISSGQTNNYSPEPYSSSLKVASPDKKNYAYVSTRDGKNDIYISDSNGKNEKRLTTIGTVMGNLVWDPKSLYLTFDSYKTAETAKYIVSTSGGIPKKITDIYLEYGREGMY
ncbi:MAG TPA: carboxypeptidase regulatory-like domain-containing protein [bacterium]|nr:carboxypeptidase regulatory-like domain-containing protein [bacterium]